MKTPRPTPLSTFSFNPRSRVPLAAAGLLVSLLAACGGGGGDAAHVADAGQAMDRVAPVIEESAEQVAEREDGTADASDAAAPVAAASADPALEAVSTKAFAGTDLISTTCLPGVTIAEAVAKLNTARATGRMCGTTWYPAAPPLVWNEALARAASLHSQDMAANNYFSHTSLDGRSPGTRITQAGYNWSRYGENIAAGQSTMDAALASWLKSPGHCKNIMNARNKDYGLGCAYKSTSRYRIYWTQDFGAQRTW